MAYDQVLANRVREVLAPVAGVDEKPMFGGLAFLVNGHMAVAVSGKGDLMVRVPPDETAVMLGRAHASPMIMSGRQARGWVRVGLDGVRTTTQLRRWVAVGVDYTGGLPPK